MHSDIYMYTCTVISTCIHAQWYLHVYMHSDIYMYTCTVISTCIHAQRFLHVYMHQWYVVLVHPLSWPSLQHHETCATYQLIMIFFPRAMSFLQGPSQCPLTMSCYITLNVQSLVNNVSLFLLYIFLRMHR